MYIRHLLLLLCCVYAFPVSGQDSLALQRQLADFQQQDNLEEWLYARMDYAVKQPAQRLPFLMATQSAAWRTPRNPDERLAWLDLHTYQGYYQLYTGHIIPSIQAYETAYRYYYDDPLPGTDVAEFILMPLGNNYTRLGDYERAQFIHDKSLRIARERKDDRAIAGACSNMAVAAQMQEQYEEAKRYARSGLQSAPAGSSIAGLLHATLAAIFHETHHADSAKQQVQQAIRVLTTARPEENTKYWLSSAYQVSGDIADSEHQPQQALAAYQKALQVLDRGRKRERARLMVKTGNSYLQLSQFAPAMRQFDQALALLLPSYVAGQLPDSASLYGEFMLIDGLEGKARALLQQGQKEQALQYMLRTFMVERRLRREFFSRATRMLHQQQSRGRAETAMELAFDLYRQTHDNAYAMTLLDIAEMTKSQTLMEELWTNLQYSRLQSKDSLLVRQRQLQQAIAYYEREAALAGRSSSPEQKEVAYELSLLQDKIKVKYPMLYQRAKRLPLADLPEGTAVKEFFAGNRFIFIIDFNNKGIQHLQRLDSGARVQQQVKDFVTTYFRNGPQAMVNAPDQYYKSAYQLYQQLWQKPVAAKRCLVIPDGWLGYLPFDALVTDRHYIPNVSRWPYLLHQIPIGLAYSLETWQQQQQQPDSGMAGVTGYFIARGTKNGPPIPAVEEEFKAVSNVAKGDFFREKEASLANFRSGFPKAAVLHLGTHAALQGNLPLLELADGQFFLFELYGVQFHPRLVVLSACRTGDGMLAEGEGIISLAREFAASGAGGIVAGLWNVHDEAGAAITGRFYERLSSAESPLQALHDAKTDWLLQDHGSQLLNLPYYWSSLTYAGHHHPVVILPARGHHTRLWIEAIALSLLAGGLSWWFIFRRRG